MAAKQKSAGTIVVDLGDKLHRRLRDRSNKETDRAGRKIPMTEITRRALEKELATPLQ